MLTLISSSTKVKPCEVGRPSRGRHLAPPSAARLAAPTPLKAGRRMESGLGMSNF